MKKELVITQAELRRINKYRKLKAKIDELGDNIKAKMLEGARVEAGVLSAQIIEVTGSVPEWRKGCLSEYISKYGADIAARHEKVAEENRRPNTIRLDIK
jgi:hypothetical protein